MAESKEELNIDLMKAKEESAKAGLKLKIKKIRSWHLVPSLHGKQGGCGGGSWKQWQISSSWALKWLQPWNQKMIGSWQESYEKPRQCVEKQRHHSADKGPYSQGYGLPSGHVRLWGWTVKKAELQKTDAFELWCWRKLLRVPWTVRRSNQSILKEINPE